MIHKQMLTISGQPFVAMIIPSQKRRYAVYLCECGNTSIQSVSNVERNHTRSCGCRANIRTHGFSGAKRDALYEKWCGMRKRCNNPKHPAYDLYGGRGVNVCPQWDDFSVFREWALTHGYELGLSIDRIDPDEDYCPENCQFLTMADNVARSNRGRFAEVKRLRNENAHLRFQLEPLYV